jgi:methyltransferase (TIGR00027 family)
MTEKITPSQTALFSAAARAAHPIVDQRPHLLHDEPAAHLCRSTIPSPLDFQLAQPEVGILSAARLSACTRSRYADACLADSDIDQVLVFGAGLDTTSFRLPPAREATVWLIDRPGVLAWRTRLFADAGLPDATHHVAADLTEGFDVGTLATAGVDLHRPALVIWLGVSMYLRPAECRAFFADIAGLATGSRLVFDYHLAPEARDTSGEGYAQAVAAMAGHQGEPWQSSSTPEEMDAWLAEEGWRLHEDVDEASRVPDGFFDAQDHLRPMTLVRLVRAMR